MTFDEKIAAIKNRIARAQSERDIWRASGKEEKHLEAYFLVEALELQLERLRQAGRPSALKNDAPIPDAAGERDRLMAEFSIAYNGRHYQYDRYRYDYLADAVDYAKLQRSTASSEGVGPMPPPEDVEAPDQSQRRLMGSLAITFKDGVYHLGTYRYDRLVDAANYARLQLAEGR